jgi:Domain of unknown function (DUF4258)
LAKLTLERLRELVRNLDYSVSLHATEELEDDNLTILDLESVLLTGDIVERQRDRITRETKVIVRGSTVEGETAECVVKLGPSGRLFIITIYRD